MIIALRSRANGRFVCAESAGDAPLIANRDRVGGWEQFDVFVVIDDHLEPLDWPSAPTPEPPPDPVPPAPDPFDPTLSPRLQFLAWVEGRPFAQQTLVDLIPTFTQHGWLLTPGNKTNGDRTKVHPPGGPWTRVGFGEGYWVWIPQAEQ